LINCREISAHLAARVIEEGIRKEMVSDKKCLKAFKRGFENLKDYIRG